MRKFIAVAVALLVGICMARAEVPVTDLETNMTEKSVSFSFETGIGSKYVGERSGKVYTDNPAVQSTFSVSIPWFDFTVWNSSSLERKFDKTAGDEIDYTISRSGEMPFQRFLSPVKTECGISYYDFSKLCSGTENDAVAFYCELSSSALMDKILKKDYFSMENYFRWEADVMTAGSEENGGTYLTFGTRGQVSGSETVRIMMDTFITRDDGVYGLEPDWILTHKMSVEIDAWGWTLAPNYVLTVPFDGKTEQVYGVSAKTEF